MALGTNLESDIRAAITNSDNASDFSSKFSTAVNNYLSGAEYAEDSGTYTSTLPSNLFLLPTAGTASLAATQIANGVQAYYGTGTVVAGIGSASQGGVSVVQCTITATLVSSTLQPSLLAIFNSVAGTLEAKAGEIATAVTTAIATITTSHTELNGSGSTIGPFIGGVT